MVDRFSSVKRSEIMSKIGSKGSRQEMYVRRLIYSMGYRFRLHRKDLPGKPDLVFPKYKKVIFVNGCYWHGHAGCSRAVLPATNLDFWKEKIAKNKLRDRKNHRDLKKLGWSYLCIWQCGIKKSKESSIQKKIINFLS